MVSPAIEQLLDESISAYQKNDMDQASKLLAQAIKDDPNNERAWLWLSGIVVTDALDMAGRHIKDLIPRLYVPYHQLLGHF